MSGLGEGAPVKNADPDWPEGSPKFERDYATGQIKMTWPNGTAREVMMTAEMLEAVVADHNRFVRLIAAQAGALRMVMQRNPVPDPILKDIEILTKQLGLPSE